MQKHKRTTAKNSRQSLKLGFSLFELIIGFLISTILTTICFSIYQRIARTTQFVQKITTNDTKAFILQNRLQQDFLGIAPLWFTPSAYEEMIKKTNAVENTNTDQGSEEKSDDSKKTKADTEKKREDNFFYSTNNQDESLNLFSFITTSSLQMYGSDNNPYVRVIYALKKTAQKDGSFSLYRKELPAGEFDPQAAHTSGFFYEIASLIKKMTIEYGFISNMRIQKNDEKKQEQPVEKETEMTWLKTWQTKQEKTESNVQKTIFPKCVKIKILFMQEKSNYEQEYEFIFTIPIDSINPYTSFTQKNYHNEMLKKPRQPSNQNSTSSSNQTNNQGSTISANPNQPGGAHAA